MPAYNFKECFVEAIQAGVKRSTIRPIRKRPTHPGETLYLYTGQRTKQCRKVATVTCTQVRTIIIDRKGVCIEGKRLPQTQAEALAYKDGFNLLADFLLFFDNHYGLPTPQMNLIEW